MDVEYLKDKIRTVPGFPKPGINFYDITTLLKDPEGLRQVVSALKLKYARHDIDLVVGIEARGFIFGSVLAHELGIGFVPARKPGKLPLETASEEYELEYGRDSVHVHKDAIIEGHNVLIVDDLLATGGTAAATTRLIEKLGGRVAGVCFMIELSFLNGREKLKDYDVFSLLKYDE